MCISVPQDICCSVPAVGRWHLGTLGAGCYGCIPFVDSQRVNTLLSSTRGALLSSLYFTQATSGSPSSSYRQPCHATSDVAMEGHATSDVAWKGRRQEEEGLPEDKRRHHEPALIRLALPPSSPPACPCVFIMAPPSTSAPFMASSRRLFCGRIHIVCATDAVFVSLERSTLPEYSTRKAGPQDRSPQAWGGLPRHFLRCRLPKGHLETPPEATYPRTCGHDIALGNPGSSDPYSQPY